MYFVILNLLNNNINNIDQLFIFNKNLLIELMFFLFYLVLIVFIILLNQNIIIIIKMATSVF